MKEQTLLALQSLLATLQALNAGLAALSHINPVITICVAAVCVGLQTFTQRIGNSLVPEEHRERLELMNSLDKNQKP